MSDTPSCTNCGEYPGDKVADRIEELESKLEKAAEALEWCAKADHSIMARFALAELKGKADE